MGRKKTTGKTDVPAAETQPELRSVRLYLPKEHHKLLRKLAADEETNMALLARRIVSEYVVRNSRKATKEGGEK